MPKRSQMLLFVSTRLCMDNYIYIYCDIIIYIYIIICIFVVQPLSTSTSPGHHHLTGAIRKLRYQRGEVCSWAVWASVGPFFSPGRWWVRVIGEVKPQDHLRSVDCGWFWHIHLHVLFLFDHVMIMFNHIYACFVGLRPPSLVLSVLRFVLGFQ